MVLSYYLLKPFYSACWRVLNLFVKRSETVFYCHTPLDMQNWLPVQEHLQPLRIVTDKPATYRDLKAEGFNPGRLPCFPKAVLMCRVAAHKFPSAKVIKIGMRHGPYHFKRFTSAKHYAPFSLYLFSSEADLKQARKAGVRCGEIGGYPKLDPWLKGRISLPPNPASNKAKILFTSTYDGSGMSAIEHWLPLLPRLAESYEIYVSLHPWMSAGYVEQIKAMPAVHYVADRPLPYIALADLVIVDSSSIIAECCALDKPLISWKLPEAPRSVAQITEILEQASIRISHPSELSAAIERCLQNPHEHQQARQNAAAIFFDKLDGEASKRTAKHITKLLPEIGL